MSIRVQRDSLLKALSKSQSIMEKRSNMPVLQYVMIRGTGSEINLWASNLQYSYEINLLGEGDGSPILIQGKKLLEIVRESKEKFFTFSKISQNELEISDGKARYLMAMTDPDEYPELDLSLKNPIQVQGGYLSKVMEKVVATSALEEVANQFAGVFIHNIPQDQTVSFVSIDNYRFSYQVSTNPELSQLIGEDKVFIPKKGVYEIIRFDTGESPLFLSLEGKTLTIERPGELKFQVKLKEHGLPDYLSVASIEPIITVAIPRKALIEAMRKMHAFSEETDKVAGMSLESDRVTVFVKQHLGEASEDIEVRYSGEAFKIYYPIKGLLDILQVMESEEVEFSFTGEDKLSMIRGPQDVGYQAFIMPVEIIDRPVSEEEGEL